MPWRNFNPNDILQLLALVLGAITGTTARIMEQIKAGERTKVLSRDLVTDMSGMLLMILVAGGMAEYFEFGVWTTVATASVLSRAGTPVVDLAIRAVIDRIRGKSK